MMVKLKDHQSYYNSSCDTRMSAQNTINPIVVEVFHSITRSNMDQLSHYSVSSWYYESLYNIFMAVYQRDVETLQFG